MIFFSIVDGTWFRFEGKFSFSNDLLDVGFSDFLVSEYGICGIFGTHLSNMVFYALFSLVFINCF